jgi:hypothetical protein
MPCGKPQGTDSTFDLIAKGSDVLSATSQQSEAGNA